MRLSSLATDIRTHTPFVKYDGPRAPVCSVLLPYHGSPWRLDARRSTDTGVYAPL